VPNRKISDFLGLEYPDSYLYANEEQFPCDTGSDVSTLKEIIREQNWPVDISLLDDNWNVKTLNSRYSAASSAIRIRARDCRKLLREKARELADSGDEDVQIVLVTHGGYLHYLTEDWEDAAKFSGTGWENTEYRTYSFEHSFTSDSDSDAYIIETMESRKRRGLDHPTLDHGKQEEIFHRMMQGWEDQGLQNPDKVSIEAGKEAASEEQGQIPADLERQITKAADEAEKTQINTRPQTIKISA
jgi:hypothetical protein